MPKKVKSTEAKIARKRKAEQEAQKKAELKAWAERPPVSGKYRTLDEWMNTPGSLPGDRVQGNPYAPISKERVFQIMREEGILTAKGKLTKAYR